MKETARLTVFEEDSVAEGDAEGFDFDPFAELSTTGDSLQLFHIDETATQAAHHTALPAPIETGDTVEETLKAHRELPKKYAWVNRRASALSWLGAAACLFHFHGVGGLGIGGDEQRKGSNGPGNQAPTHTHLSGTGDFFEFLFGAA